MLDEAQLKRIQDPDTKQVVLQIANLLEQALTEIDTLRAELQRLKDENNRLKGEQGKPDVKASKPPLSPKDTSGQSTDHSSEEQRRERSPRSKGTKNDKIVIHRTVKVEVEKESLPADAVSKGYETVIIQNLRLQLDNVEFMREVFYSPSTGKSYMAPLPLGYEGGFGPELKALLLNLHHLGNMSQPAIHNVFTQAGILVPTGWIGEFLIADQEGFHQEKQDIALAGLASGPWQQIDDTATRVNGVNQHCHVLGNPLYTVYTTVPKRNRRSVLTVLHNGQPVPYLVNTEVLESDVALGLSKACRKALAAWPQDTAMDENEVLCLLDKTMPKLTKSSRKILMDTMAVAGYLAQTEVPVVKLLLCDDAPQFPGLTEELALCWVHDARHYQKLTPHLPLYRTTLDAFKKRYWDYYDLLLAYRKQPTPEGRRVLWDSFDALFVPKTGYEQLDHRIRQTAANKGKLLQVLAHPEIPLHNNASELAVRRRVRKRDVSFGPRSAAGLAAWDTFQTILATAQKLGVCFLAYIADRVSGRNEMPSLASLIRERASELNLGGSWA